MKAPSRISWLWLLLLQVTVLSALAVSGQRITFQGEKPGSQARTFLSLVGIWRIDIDGGRSVYAVDGRNWEQGMMAPGAEAKAKLLFGEKHGDFLRHLETYRYFPLSICKPVQEFRNGSIEVSFKPAGGKIDQAAGIAFDIRPNGDYLVLRANALENNVVLFKMEGGRRSTLQWARNVPTASNRWHRLKVVVKENKIEGYLNDTKYIDYLWREGIDGRLGLWSKADSYVYFDDLFVNTR